MYRDDHDAALRRIAQLEAQLAEARAAAGDTGALRERVGNLEAELGQARSQLEPAKPAPRRARPLPPAEPLGGRVVGVLVGVGLAAILVSYLIDQANRSPPRSTSILLGDEGSALPDPSGIVPAADAERIATEAHSRIEAARGRFAKCHDGLPMGLDLVLVLGPEPASFRVEPPDDSTPTARCVLDILATLPLPGPSHRTVVSYRLVLD